MIKVTQKIFEADSESLYDFVSKNGRGLYIPPYQRQYAWDKSNIERLIADTLQGISAVLKRPDDSITFIGTIIAMNDAKKTTINPLVKNQVYSQVMTIIDGQQRLTTLLMLCMSLYVEIEVNWSELNHAKIVVQEDTRAWIETHVNNVLGNLSQMLSEEQKNGKDEFRHFPKMIRAFKDTWSYDADKAAYSSPIAWLIFEFVKYSRADSPNWSRFWDQVQKAANSVAGDKEKKNFVKLMRVMRSKLKYLPEDEEFADFADIIHLKDKQEAIFNEEFPDEMKAGLLEFKAAKGGIGGNQDELDKKNLKWWETANNLLSLIFFAQFVLERITLVVVTATTEDFAFDVFEALNTTGQPLTALETFTPKVVQTIGIAQYNSSEEKRQLDVAFDYLNNVSGSDARQKRSADLLIAFALAERGEKQSKNLADQRRFMRDTFGTFENRTEQRDFIRHLADLTRFFDETFVDEGVPTVSGLSLPTDAALCLRFLVSLGHTITAPLLAQYAAAIIAAQEEDDRNKAVAEFTDVVKAVTAFAVIWRASRPTTDRIDQVFRELMSKGSPEFGFSALARGIRGTNALPGADVIKNVLVSKLKADRISGGASISGKDEWIEKTIIQPLYDINTSLARFILMAAFHDTVEGKFCSLVAGKAGTHVTMTLDAWTTGRYASVEHIAPQSGGGSWSKDLYADDEYERIGNLTLLPLPANQSLGNRPWDQKRKLYQALAARTEDEAALVLTELQKLGVDISVTANQIHGSSFLPHLSTIANFEAEWTLPVVEKRGRELTDLAWQRLAPWLGWNAS